MNKLEILEDKLKCFDEPDIYFLYTVKELEKDLIDDKKLFKEFLEMIPYYFEDKNYYCGITILLSHIFEPSIRKQICLFFLKQVYVNRYFTLKHKEKILKIIELTTFNKEKLNKFKNEYEDALNICFSEKPELIKFDSNTTDYDIDKFFNSL